MTPISSHPAGRDSELDAIEEEYQSHVFAGFTTSELIQSGAYAPNFSPVIPSSNLPTDLISPLLARNKWELGPLGTEATNPRLLYNLDGPIEFNVNEVSGQTLWDAIQPALLIATRVLEIHPLWLAMIDICKIPPLHTMGRLTLQLPRPFEKSSVRTRFSALSTGVLIALWYHLTPSRPPPAST